MRGDSITLRLGEFTFARGEVPEGIGFGASQQLHVHSLVGGARVVDAMGPVPVRPEWSGWFIGPDRLARARFLKRLAEAGQMLPLRFGEFAYSVIISTFSAEFRAGPNLPYHIALEVICDHGVAQPGGGVPGLTQMIAQDLAGLGENAAAIGDSDLIGSLAAVATAVSVLGSADITRAAIRPVLPAIAAANAQAGRLNVAASAQLAALAALSAAPADGDLAGAAQRQQFGAGLVAAAGAARQSHLLQATAQRLGRMTNNLTAVSGTSGGAGTTVTTGATDLYHLAAAAYGDPLGWTQIAQANGLSDPVVAGLTQLVIPSADGRTATGVLNV